MSIMIKFDNTKIDTKISCPKCCRSYPDLEEHGIKCLVRLCVCGCKFTWIKHIVSTIEQTQYHYEIQEVYYIRQR